MLLEVHLFVAQWGFFSVSTSVPSAMVVADRCTQLF